ncbi:hypothetical protein [Pedobacter suwonensis]|uniref:hypothetical protein n=1 Tax=Pedobacter suwonensis TaxID=332999 RepID=UPI0011A824E4|nr:hypothetical protein [Pedobacter suwonensis]
MEAQKIELEINHGMDSFIRDSKISTYITEFLDKFKDKFPHTLVHLHLFEEVQSSTNDIKPRALGKAKNRKLRIDIGFERFRKGASLTTPSPEQFFSQLNFVMNKEVENYKNNINKINPVLRARLKRMGIDLSTEKNADANDLKGSLATANYTLNFDLRINELTDEDLYQLGSSIIVQANKGKIYTRPEVIREMAEKLEDI